MPDYVIDPPAQSLVPVAGVYAKYLFAIGLFGASMLAMAVVLISTVRESRKACIFGGALGR